MNKIFIVEKSNLGKVIGLFGFSVIVAIIIYIIIGLVISNVENNFVNNPVPLDQLRQKIEEKQKSTTTLENIRALAVFLVFPVFTIFAAKPVFQFTKSILLRVLMLLTFAFFPIILLLIIFLMAILIGGYPFAGR